MAEGGHVVARKSEGVVQAAERKLDVVFSLSLKLSKWMKPALAVFAVRRDRKIQLTSKIPKRVVLRLV
jgi:hypothetical protein